MKFSNIISALILVVLLWATAVSAGVVAENRFESKATGQSGTMKYMFDEHGMRMENNMGMGPNLFIFNSAQKVFWMINTQKGTYMEMTQADLEKFNNIMEQHQRMVEKHMENIPPQQREMMKKYMSGMMGKESRAKTVYKKVASGVKVNQWKCDQYEGLKNGEKVADVWTADWKELGFSESDLAALEEFTTFFESFRARKSKMKDFGFGIGSAEDEDEGGYSGIPVKTIHYRNGEVEMVNELVSLKRQNLESSLFELPSGLQKEKSPFQDMPEAPKGWQ